MITGLISEYNPFHKGHLFHLSKAKEITSSKYIVVVQSGNFVQRGEPAICDKYSRTLMALKNGADLVLELPVFYATSSAESFAKGAVTILNKSNIIDYLCFGSECGDIEKLNEVSSIIIEEPIKYKKNLKIALSEGKSFPSARNIAINSIIGNTNQILNNANNILGIEYIKWLKKFNSKIIPVTVQRIEASYNSRTIENEISSATAIRLETVNKNYELIKKAMPKESYDIFINEVRNDNICFFDNYSDILHYILKTTSVNSLSKKMDITEGIENRILKSAEKYYYISDIIKDIKTKRYTHTKIQRAVLHIILDIQKEMLKKLDIYGGPQYIRVLGFRKKSQHILKLLSEKSDLPIITNIKNSEKILDKLGLAMLKKEIETSDLYYLAQNNINPKAKNYEYRVPLVIID